MSKTDWGFSDDETQKEVFDTKAYEASLKRYATPIKSHDCDEFGCEGRYGSIGNNHEYQEIWDDFQLSPKQREKVFSELVSSRGRQHREMTLLRQFVSTLDGSYVLRLETVNQLTKERFGDISFQTREECNEYYNYCVQLFGFSRSLMVRDNDDEGDGDFFDNLDDISGGFFDDLDEMSGDSEDEVGWDIDEDEELTWE